MHGELLKARCTKTGRSLEWHEDICANTKSPFDESATLRPDIVWFGEMPFFMDEIYTALENCNLFISIGTSGNVYPAAGFVEIARSNGARCIELNLDPSNGSNKFHESRRGPASIIVPEFVDELLTP